MDSGNSGSLQSSSGGDVEYNSRAACASTTAFINNHQTLPQPPPSLHHPSLFDPLSNYFDPLPRPSSNPNQNQNPFLNLDQLPWSKPDPFSSPQPDSSLPSTIQPLPPVTTDHNSRATSSTSSTLAVQNPKKRSRASRRAPTTVLTTDITNFRAMVQEFTGIPAPPFSSSSSPFPRSRLDLFGTSSSIRFNPHTFDNTPPPYLLRPFPQKLQPPHFLISTSLTPSPATLNTAGSACSNFQANFLSQTIPSSSFLPGMPKPNNSVSIVNASSNDHEFGRTSGSVRDGSNYNSYSTASFQASEITMNGNLTRGEGMVESWMCSTTNTG